jgi:hypothetical protein
MKGKKIILILLLIFSVASLFVIAHFSKNKQWLFGRLYDAHVKSSAERYSKAIKSSLEKVFSEVRALSEDNLVKSVFVSSTLGENTDRYSANFGKVKDGIRNCQKIQTIITDGKIIFSTASEEINSQKLKDSILQKLKEYFSMNQSPFVYFIDKKQFVVLYPLMFNPDAKNTITDGFVAIYYDNQRLLDGFTLKNLKIPFSYENFVFLSSGMIDNSEINRIVGYYNSGTKMPKKENLESTVGGISEFNGIRLIYYAKNERYVSYFTIAALVLNLILLGMTIFALMFLLKEEKMYSDISLNTMNKGLEPVSSKDNLQSLVDDIKQNKNFDEETAQKGIEDMILSHDIDLTRMQSDQSVSSIDKMEFDIPKDNLDVISEDQPLNIQEIEPEAAFVEPSSSSQSKIFEPSRETELFAEHDRILNGTDNTPFEENPEMPMEHIQLESNIEESFKTDSESNHFEIAPDTISEETFDIPMPETESISEAQMDFSQIDMTETTPQVEEETINQPEEPLVLDQQEGDIQIDSEAVPIPSIVAIESDDYKNKVELDPENERLVKEVLSQPPVRLSAIISVEDYANVALDLAQNMMGIGKIYVFKKEGNEFKTLLNHGFKSGKVSISLEDPVYEMFLSRGKSVDITGDLKNTRYLQERFPKDLDFLEEMLIVPVMRHDSVEGLAFYARERNTREPSSLQKSEVFNLGFLQEE